MQIFSRTKKDKRHEMELCICYLVHAYIIRVSSACKSDGTWKYGGYIYANSIYKEGYIQPFVHSGAYFIIFPSIYTNRQTCFSANAVNAGS